MSDKESLKKIPDVPGLVSYRKDSKRLYVNQGSKWESLSTETEVSFTYEMIKDKNRSDLILIKVFVQHATSSNNVRLV